MVATPAPRLTWTVETEEPSWLQASAELRSGAEPPSSRVATPCSIEWPFAPLAPGETRAVQVRVTRRGAAARRRGARRSRSTAGFLGRRRLDRPADRPRRSRARGAAVPGADDVRESTAPVRSGDPVLDGARRRRARGERRGRLRRCARARGGPATATASCTIGSTSPRPLQLGRRTRSAPASPAPGPRRRTDLRLRRPRSTATSRRSSHSCAWSSTRPTATSATTMVAGGRQRPGRRHPQSMPGSTRTCARPIAGVDAVVLRRRRAPVRVGPAARSGYENVPVPVPEARIALPVRRVDVLSVAEALDLALGRARCSTSARTSWVACACGWRFCWCMRINLCPRGSARRGRARPPPAAERGILKASVRPRRLRQPAPRSRGSTFHGFRYVQIERWPGSSVDSADVEACRCGALT